MAKKKVQVTQMNMTPMIDCVFLLNLFFMTVTELTRQDDIEDVRLPDVKAAAPDSNPDPDRLVINVLKDGRLIVRGYEYSYEELEAELMKEAQRERALSGASDALPTNRLVLIKADRRVRFEHIRYIMALCVEKHIGIWRMSFGTLPGSISRESEGGSGD
jgi:biopolymer transport protein ExbD